MQGIEKVMGVIDSILAYCYSNSSNNQPYNMAHSHASMSAAIDGDIDLDGVYFLLHSEPDVSQKLLFAVASDNVK